MAEHFTHREVQILKQMRESGASYKEISRVLPHRSPNCLRNKLHRLNNPPGWRARVQEKNTEEFDRIRKLYEAGATTAAVVNATGYSHSHIRYILRFFNARVNDMRPLLKTIAAE